MIDRANNVQINQEGDEMFLPRELPLRRSVCQYKESGWHLAGKTAGCTSKNTIFPCLIFLEACVWIGVNHIQNKWQQAFIFPPRRLPERRAPRHFQPQAVIKLRHASLFSLICLFFHIRFWCCVGSESPAGHLLQSLLMWLLTPSSYIKCCVNCNIPEADLILIDGGICASA